MVNATARDIYAGVSFGALVGFASGLSTSPIATSLISTLSAAAMFLVGALPRKNEGDGETSPRTPSDRQLLRASAFATACIAGIAIGIYTRSSELLSRSTTPEIIKQMIDSGVPAKDALVWATEHRSSSGGLVGNDDVSDLFDPSRVAPEQAIKNFQALGEPWKSIADFVATAPQNEQGRILKLYWDYKKKETNK